MDKLRVLIFFGLLAIVIIIARWGAKPTSQPESPTFATPAPKTASTSPLIPPSPAASSPSPAQPAPAQPDATQTAELKKGSEETARAVVLITVFDESGKLLRTGSGFFVSDDGRIVTSKSVVDGAANAVAKTNDGKIYNISGILADANALDVAVLKADAKKRVSFVLPSNAVTADAGARIGVITSPLTRRKTALYEGTIAARKSDQNGDWLEVSTKIPHEAIGAPVINQSGEIIGLVTSQQMPDVAGKIVRPSNALDPLLAQLQSGVATGWQWAQKFQEPGSPAESPTPTPSRFAKIPIVQTNQPGTRLVYSPKPKYPGASRQSDSLLKGSGRYRVTFDASGVVRNVEIVESTRSQALDSAAADALRRWKAAPGQEWTATVPVTFEP